jgi:spermidine/putrescine transport system permease protein
MSSNQLRTWVVRGYILLFFLYLFGPLLIMSASAFNASSYPTITPWEGTTTKWFGELAANDRLVNGFINSFWVGLGVVVLSVPTALAGAIMLMQVPERVRPIYYTIVVSPVLVPGVIIGISTVIFWERFGSLVGLDYETTNNPFFLTIVGQSTFISAYCMLVFIARLQRFDKTQEEAALDLGATHVQVFWKVLIPFLRPAILSSIVLAFLTSFENYNTTVFTMVARSTLTTELAGLARFGVNPSISALAVVIMGLTLICAVIYEIKKRREEAIIDASKRRAAMKRSKDTEAAARQAAAAA